MKNYLVVIFLLSFSSVIAQNIPLDSLRRSLVTAKEDTTKIQLLWEFGSRYLYTKPDTSLILYRQGLELARKDKLTKWEVIMLSRIGYAMGYFPTKKDSALIYMQESIALSRQNNFYSEEAWCYTSLSLLYFFEWKQPDSAFRIATRGIEFAEKNKLPEDQLDLRLKLSTYYAQSGKLENALEVCFDGILNFQKNKLPTLEFYCLEGINGILGQSQSINTSQPVIEKAMTWARKSKQKKFEGFILLGDGNRLMNLLNYPEAFRSFLGAIKIFENLHEEYELAYALDKIGEIYYNLAEYRNSLSYYSHSIMLREKLMDTVLMEAYRRIGSNYARLNMHDSAVYFAKKSYAQGERYDHFEYLLDDIAEIYTELGEDSIAMLYFRRSLPKFLPTDLYYDVNRAEIFAGIAKLFKKAGQNDSAFFYANLSLPLAQAGLLKGVQHIRLMGYIYDASNIIAEFYRSKHRLDSAFIYQEIKIAAKDSLSGQEKIRELRTIEFNEQLRQQQAKEDSIKSRNRVNTYFFVGGIAVILLIALLLYRNNRIKQKANSVLQQQKQKVENTLEQLKSTQQQLIQSEKMASLGELTAGIAHEIQNPLNFVNNFSEVNEDLLKELKTEAEKGNLEEVKAIANDIAFNSEKINHHGKRADSIVKGMLQHSRTSTGQKEPTDINALCDEYLRLAYHGLRAKDKSFNAITKTEFDNSVGKLNVVSQDLGRVILNLINNAFYAVNEKKKSYELSAMSYEPTVTVITEKRNGKVAIKVKDNGNGIPQKNLDKIFQPFFTTKPTGQGTGLGLSLAYDIVTKGHGGELKVETMEGEGSEFVIYLSQG